MLRRRVTLVTIHCLRTLPKVCRSSNSIKNFNFLRNLSTASERLDFDYSNGLNNGFNQIPNGNYGQTHNGNVVGHSGYFPSNSDGVYDGKRVQQQRSSVGVYGENHGSAKQQDPVGKAGVFEDDKFVSNFREGFHQGGDLTSGYIREGNRGEQQSLAGNSNFGSRNPQNLASNWHGVREGPDNQYESLASRYTEGHRDEFQRRQNPNFAGGNFGNFGVNSNGFQHMHIGQGHRDEFQQGPGGQRTNFGCGSNESMQSHSIVDVRHSRTRQQSGKSPSGFNTLGPAKPQPNLDGRYAQGAMESTVGYHGGNVSSPQQNASRYDAGNVGAPQQYSQNYSALSTQNYQQRQVNHNEVNAGISQQSHNVGNIRISKHNLQNYDARSTGNFQQSQGYYNEVTMHPQVADGIIRQNDETPEDGDNVKLNGTIEELDLFLKEGNLKVVERVLDMLEKQGIPVDLPRYLAMMKLCSEDKALEEAKSVHKRLIRSVTNPEVSTYNKILETYCDCGSIVDAFSVFDNMPRSLTSWDIMITGLVKNGQAEAALELFTEFEELGLKPDGRIYLGVFSACSALFDTSEGMLHFESMAKDHGIVPSMEHYASVVDMLGSAGHLDEALEFIQKMPMEPSMEIWEALMNVSRIQGDVELGDRCAELIDLLDPSRLNEQSRAGFIPLKASDLSKEKEKKKLDGQSPLEIRSRVHEYRAGDRSHPDHEKLYALLWGLRHQMKEYGYLPETKFVLHDIDQESKEEALLSHSERLAVAKGLLNTPARTTMRVIKNLRVCGDCHNAMKIISKLVGRELIMRDAKRFHHFKDGICSCRDYW